MHLFCESINLPAPCWKGQRFTQGPSVERSCLFYSTVVYTISAKELMTCETCAVFGAQQAGLETTVSHMFCWWSTWIHWLTNQTAASQSGLFSRTTKILYLTFPDNTETLLLLLSQLCSALLFLPWSDVKSGMLDLPMVRTREGRMHTEPELIQRTRDISSPKLTTDKLWASVQWPPPTSYVLSLCLWISVHLRQVLLFLCLFCWSGDGLVDCRWGGSHGRWA